MRYLVMAAAAVFALGTVPASAGSHWKCQGPAYVCGSPAKAKKSKSYSAPKSTTYKQASKPKSSATKKYTKKKTATWKPKSSSGVKKKKTYSAKAYGGSVYQTGIASYYWQPQKVASGGWFNPNAMTAAHKTLPFGTKVRVTHSRTGKSVVVRINDRGPYIKGRIIDLSRAAAGVIGMRGSGIAPVKITVLGKG